MLSLKNPTIDITGKNLAYLNNPNLKGVNQNLEFSEEHIKQLIKCKNDIVYFAENYYYIVHQDLGKVKIKLRDYQKKILQSFFDNRFNVNLSSRQSGKSTVFAVFIMHFIIFNDNKNVALLANKKAQSSEILDRIKVAYQELPKWLQQSVTIWNKGEIQLENGSRVQAHATSSDSIRGQSISLLVIDECICGDSKLTVRDKETKEIKQITIEELFNEM